MQYIRRCMQADKTLQVKSIKKNSTEERIEMGQLNVISLMLGILILVVGSSIQVGGMTIEDQLASDIESLRNESVEGYFNIPNSDLSNITALNYYDLVTASEGNDSVGLSLRYVPAMGYSKPNPFGYCEYGPVWAIHYVPGYLFWPPIPKRVCHRPCPIYGYRCRPACCETYCIYRYVWRYYGYYCLPYGWQKVCYEQHNCCKASCGYGYPYCYL